MKPLVLILLLTIASLNRVQAANFGVTPHPKTATQPQQSSVVSHHTQTKHVKPFLKHTTRKYLKHIQNTPAEKAADKEFVWALIAFIGISLAVVGLIVLGIVFNLVWLWIFGAVLTLVWLTLIILVVHIFSHWRLC